MVFSPPKRSQSLAYRRSRSRTTDTTEKTPSLPLSPGDNQQLQSASLEILRIEAGSRSTPDLTSPDTDRDTSSKKNDVWDPSLQRKHTQKSTLNARDRNPIKRTNTTHPLPRVVTQIHPPTRSSSLRAGLHTPLTAPAIAHMPKFTDDYHSQPLSPVEIIPSPVSISSPSGFQPHSVIRPLKASKSESSACTEDYETADEFRNKSFEIPETTAFVDDCHNISSDPPLSEPNLGFPQPTLSSSLSPSPSSYSPTQSTSISKSPEAQKKFEDDVHESLLEWKLWYTHHN
ncbi:hypothetical protein J3Q64DRAFT_1713245 [Phycomyces blakesleeanus]|uniref:Uncharacterized protein n=2 Tax=Phycomyces blakesleeanus TaxID=4837 RepID=A0A162Y9C4_PHYB8|nr:hypothetical protein PHYBLDRAFT_75413 [Phycomyces blakesleeanus NRRL 1555(-)]OAD79145.1 hypothetical protein PHYBLDRAFT_75413 [Phycomyces blakesleeanus NRRL 1555(-)]|eukprot:XP_018297185.1 hypothetical protein PHYBLDRAFT_75413 [Phycomyces blakesleeanus NRRL 1555(-)]